MKLVYICCIGYMLLQFTFALPAGGSNESGASSTNATNGDECDAVTEVPGSGNSSGGSESNGSNGSGSGESTTAKSSGESNGSGSGSNESNSSGKATTANNSGSGSGESNGSGSGSNESGAASTKSPSEEECSDVTEGSGNSSDGSGSNESNSSGKATTANSSGSGSGESNGSGSGSNESGAASTKAPDEEECTCGDVTEGPGDSSNGSGSNESNSSSKESTASNGSNGSESGESTTAKGDSNGSGSGSNGSGSGSNESNSSGKATTANSSGSGSGSGSNASGSGESNGSADSSPNPCKVSTSTKLDSTTTTATTVVDTTTSQPPVSDHQPTTTSLEPTGTTSGPTTVEQKTTSVPTEATTTTSAPTTTAQPTQPTTTTPAPTTTTVATTTLGPDPSCESFEDTDDDIRVCPTELVGCYWNYSDNPTLQEIVTFITNYLITLSKSTIQVGGNWSTQCSAQSTSSTTIVNSCVNRINLRWKNLIAQFGFRTFNALSNLFIQPQVAKFTTYLNNFLSKTTTLLQYISSNYTYISTQIVNETNNCVTVSSGLVTNLCGQIKLGYNNQTPYVRTCGRSMGNRIMKFMKTNIWKVSNFLLALNTSFATLAQVILNATITIEANSTATVVCLENCLVGVPNGTVSLALSTNVSNCVIACNAAADLNWIILSPSLDISTKVVSPTCSSIVTSLKARSVVRQTTAYVDYGMCTASSWYSAFVTSS